MSETACLAPDAVVHPVRFPVPRGAWDTHIHAIGALERFPLAANRSYTPAQVPIEAYVALMDRLGIAHAVLVQPSIYGTDNRAMIDALSRYPERFRGIAVVDPGIGDSELAALHEVGVRGVRARRAIRRSRLAPATADRRLDVRSVRRDCGIARRRRHRSHGVYVSRQGSGESGLPATVEARRSEPLLGEAFGAVSPD